MSRDEGYPLVSIVRRSYVMIGPLPSQYLIKSSTPEPRSLRGGSMSVRMTAK
jgi:hypothetical protein